MQTTNVHTYQTIFGRVINRGGFFNSSFFGNKHLENLENGSGFSTKIPTGIRVSRFLVSSTWSIDTTYISGIGYAHKARGLEDKTNNFLITKILEDLRRKRVKSSNVRAPVTLDLLRRLLQALQKVCTSNYEVCLFSSAFTLAFFALLRIGEIASDNKSDTGPHVICYEDISFSNKNEMYLRIRSSKADQRGKNTLIISEQKGSESDICPVKRLKQFVVMRYSGPTCSSPVYVHFDGSNLTRYQFNSV